MAHSLPIIACAWRAAKIPTALTTDIQEWDVGLNLDQGNKLAGNYNIAGLGNNVALGHNSVVEVHGEYFVVCHVRDSIGGMHHVETRPSLLQQRGLAGARTSPLCGRKRRHGDHGERSAGEFDVVVHTSGVSGDHRQLR